MTQEFLDAVKEGNIELVRELLINHKVDVNATDADGCTALFEAAKEGRFEMVRLLLAQEDIEIDHTSIHGETALSGAISGYYGVGYLDIVERLLKQGAKKNLGEVLVWAAREGHESLVQDLLEDHKVDVNATDKYGETALFQAAQEGHLEIVDLLLAQAGIDIEHTSKDGETALSCAVEGYGVDQLSIVQRLLAWGAKKNLDKALLWAADRAHEELVRELLINHKVDVNATDKYGETALFQAAQEGHLEIVDLLLAQAGIDIEHTSKDGETALSCAAGAYGVDQLAVVQRLLGQGAKKNLGKVLVWAANRAHEELVRNLLENHKVDVNATNATGYTALFEAATKGNEPCIKMLLEAGANPLLAVNGNTPFDLLPRHLKKLAASFKIRKDYNLSEAVDEKIVTNFWKFHGQRGEILETQKMRIATKLLLMRLALPKSSEDIIKDIQKEATYQEGKIEFNQYEQFALLLNRLPQEIIHYIIELKISSLMEDTYAIQSLPEDIHELRLSNHFLGKSPIAAINKKMPSIPSPSDGSLSRLSLGR